MIKMPKTKTSPQNSTPYWKMKKVGNSAELILYGEISDSSFWGDEVTPKEIDAELKAMGDDVTEIVVRINSIGGDVFAGIAIHAMLKRHKASITTMCDGLAASIASVIFMAGDKRIITNGGMVMVHGAMSGVFGDYKKLQARADLLVTITNQMVSIYSEATGLTVEEVAKLVDGVETWMTADEALSNGFATEVEKNAKIAASLKGTTAIVNGVKMDFSKFTSIPQLIATSSEPDEETVDPLTDDEITALRELLSGAGDGGDDDDDVDASAKLITATQARNLDLEMKSLFLIEKSN